jgi:hypothetical protein
MALAGFDLMPNMGNAVLNSSIDNERMNGYSESMMPVLRGLVWD